MIDYAKITVTAGKGGNGAGSFHKLKGKKYGKANGGDGGDGGNVYIEASQDINTLEKYRFVKDYQAQNGAQGFPNFKQGATGEDLVLKVPVGTQVTTQDGLLDLAQNRERILVARGGMGGRGNSKIRDELGRRPTTGEHGQEGEQQALTLELKLIADIGLIGLPNAGKSTLISKLTAAKPKVADYPFTTLEPNLGVLEVKSQQSTVDSKLSTLTSDFRLILADIPGLIEGASKGKGLGDLFLKHIERTKILVHLIDVSQGQSLPGGLSLDKLWQNYQEIRNELENYSQKGYAYSKGLGTKKEIIVLSKIDLVDEKVLKAAQNVFAKKRKKTLAISAQTGQGLEELVKALSEF